MSSASSPSRRSSATSPSVYNGAVADAQTYLRDRLSDLEGVCYHDEFGYWPKAERRRD